MPFEDASFDLVLNRHGGFRAAEMHRILKPRGVFLTQQVGGDNLADLAAVFGATLPYPDNTLPRVRADLVDLGCEIRRGQEWRGPLTFHDVAAVVYFLKAVPWVVQGFEVKRHLAGLEALQTRLDEGQPLQFTCTRFLIEAVKTPARDTPGVGAFARYSG
jgi:SAM-dependent methyltransferase